MNQPLRLAEIVKESIVDGPGLRYAVFSQGCRHACPDCFNPQTHDFDGGSLYDVSEILQDIAKNPLLKGITCTGGDPMEQPEAFACLARGVHEMGKDVWAYSGYTFEQLLDKGSAVRLFLEELDVLVDGRFDPTQKSYQLRYRGSANQRIIDVQKSLAEDRIIEMTF